MNRKKEIIEQPATHNQSDLYSGNLTVPECEGDKRAAKIARRLEAIPRAFRAVYRNAIAGGSLRAAVNAMCHECIGWHIKEIRQCSDSACPLFSVRPYQNISQNSHHGRFIVPESRKNTRRA
jgi:hypothetical protein